METGLQGQADCNSALSDYEQFNQTGIVVQLVEPTLWDRRLWVPSKAESHKRL